MALNITWVRPLPPNTWQAEVQEAVVRCQSHTVRLRELILWDIVINGMDFRE